MKIKQSGSSVAEINYQLPFVNKIEADLRIGMKILVRNTY